MPFTSLNTFPNANTKFSDKITNLKKLLGLLEERDLPEHLKTHINTQIAAVNELKGEEKKDCKQVLKYQQAILKQLEKSLKIVPKNYYRNLWMILGMTAFGLPIGVALGAGLGNMAFLGIGLPIGMSFGLALGARMDQKAAKEGRQLDFTATP